jgi:hypothetical protein
MPKTKVKREFLQMDSSEARICSECGELISAALLEKFPYAIRCIHCKARHEKEPDGPLAGGKSEYLSAKVARRAEASSNRRHLRRNSGIM